MSDDNQKLNPQITSIEIGIRNLRKVTIYPLSIGDQFSVDEVIVKALSGFEVDTASEGQIIQFVFTVIKGNLAKIIEFVTDKEEVGGGDLLKDITNDQMLAIISIIYKVNYESQIKNAQSLFSQIQQQFQLERQSPQSVNDTEDTDLSTSTDSDSIKEELQEAS